MRLLSADQVLERYWNRQLPVDPRQIAQALGIWTYARHSHELDPGVSGYAHYANGRQEIAFNVDESPTRQRFTIAHEIAHHLLGHTLDGVYLLDNASHYRASTENEVEAQANQFATQLLIPRQALQILIERRGITQLVELARALHVSEAAVYQRLQQLGWVR
ncbi:MAG: ImmA/IrrE family metallo-endopeptidase [Aeromonas sp.]